MTGISGKVKKLFFIALGTLSLGVGLLGVIIPVLPTTPFLILAVACYLRGSERLHHWMLNNSLFGGLVKDYLEGRGMKAKQKVFTLIFLWLTITITVVFFIEAFTVKVLLLLIATAVSVHILTLPSGNR